VIIVSYQPCIVKITKLPTVMVPKGVVFGVQSFDTIGELYLLKPWITLE